MIYVGIDDTDTLETPGTNQLARLLVAGLAGRCRPRHIVRHQLLFDPRVPYTSKNGSASIVLEPLVPLALPDLIDELRHGMQAHFVKGSDPGLCVAEVVPPPLTEFGIRCQHEIVSQAEARALAAAHNIYLEGLGGTEGGIIGALAAVGLIAQRNDGRVIMLGEWPDDLSGPQAVTALRARGVSARDYVSGSEIDSGRIDLGKRLRPNLRAGNFVLFAEPTLNSECSWRAVKLT